MSQELLTVTFLLNRLQDLVEGDAKKLAKDANQNIKSVMDELHNISVLLRPSALDHMGFGCGLLGMQERAEIVGAQLDIQSGAGGTRIVLTTPMSLASEDAEASAEGADAGAGAGASVSAQAAGAGAGAGAISANSPAGANEIAAHQTTN